MKILSVSNRNKQQSPSFSASTSFLSDTALELKRTFGVRRAQRTIEKKYPGRNIVINRSLTPCGDPYYTAKLHDSNPKNEQVQLAHQLGGNVNSFLIKLGKKLRQHPYIKL